METTVANRVREWREKEGLSRADLGRLADVAEKTIQRVEEGARNVRATTKHKIVQGFNLKASRLREYTFEFLFPNG